MLAEPSGEVVVIGHADFFGDGLHGPALADEDLGAVEALAGAELAEGEAAFGFQFAVEVVDFITGAFGDFLEGVFGAVHAFEEALGEFGEGVDFAVAEAVEGFEPSGGEEGAVEDFHDDGGDDEDGFALFGADAEEFGETGPDLCEVGVGHERDGVGGGAGDFEVEVDDEHHGGAVHLFGKRVGLAGGNVDDAAGAAVVGAFSHLLFSAAAEVDEELAVVVGMGGPDGFRHVVIQAQPVDAQGGESESEVLELQGPVVLH